MKLPLSWLKDYTDVSASVKEYCDALTLSGSKGEGMYYVNQLGYPHVYYYHNAEGGGVREDRRNIGTSGCGHSGIICQHFAHLMCCIERPARFVSPAEAVHGATGFIQEGDVMVFASRGGKTKELLPIVDICKAKGVKIITVTENLESPLATAADVVLKQHVNRETDKWNAQGTTSTTALCMIFHALQAALIEHTGYQAEQFALIHPGGAVGERLNNKAL